MFKKILTASLIVLASMSATADYKVGSWVSDITPTEAEAAASCMGGYGSYGARCGYTDVLDAITVRAISIADEDTDMLMGIIDTVGVGDTMITEIQDRVALWTGLKQQDIRVAATHTHAGPDFQGLWGGVSEEYKERAIKQTVFAMVMARFTALPVDITAFTTTADVKNRRGWDVIDDTVNVLVFKLKGTPITLTTLVNMSAHPTILNGYNNAYSAGYVHSLRKALHQKRGGTIVFVNGAVGDMAPVVESHTYEGAGKYGNSIANAIYKAKSNAVEIHGDFSLEHIDVVAEVVNPGVIGAIQAGILDLYLDENLNVNTTISTFSFGDQISGVAVPGEALTRLTTPMKDAMDSEFKLFFGLTGGSYGYMIPSDEFLQVAGRTTEESASLSPLFGDIIKQAYLSSVE